MTDLKPSEDPEDCKGGEGGRWRNSVYMIKYSVDGGWSEFSAWSECSKKCGYGVARRRRSCTNPAPAHGGEYCEGPSMETRRCQVKPCPVNGGWSRFSGWSHCNKPCGWGIQSRKRSCTNPAPAYGGETCKGASVETHRCQLKPCPVNGGWRYGNWGGCSKPCGGGTQWRSRSCTNPRPAYGGRNCVGTTREQRRCNTHKCPCFNRHGDFWCTLKVLLCWHRDVRRDCGKTCKACH